MFCSILNILETIFVFVPNHFLPSCEDYTEQGFLLIAMLFSMWSICQSGNFAGTEGSKQRICSLLGSLTAAAAGTELTESSLTVQLRFAIGLPQSPLRPCKLPAIPFLHNPQAEEQDSYSFIRVPVSSFWKTVIPLFLLPSKDLHEAFHLNCYSFHSFCVIRHLPKMTRLCLLMYGYFSHQRYHTS